jgi:antitoxin HicB
LSPVNFVAGIATSLTSRTSHSQVSRLLDPRDGNVTLATLQRAARIVGCSLRLEVV